MGVSVRFWLRGITIASAMLLAACAATPPPLPEPSPNAKGASPLLGIGYGLDHAVIAVHNLESAKDFFRDTLGFNLPARGIAGMHPGGTHNSSAYFADGTYIELIAVRDRALAESKQSKLLPFLASREGAMSVVMSTSDAAATAGALQSRGFAVTGPTPGTVQRPSDKTMPAPKWWTVSFADPAPAPHFFIQYAKMDYRDMEENWDEGFAEARKAPALKQSNTVLGLSAAWIVVKDADAAARRYEAMGLKSGGAFANAFLGARGRVVFVKRHRLLLLQPTDAMGRAARFLNAHGEGVMGISLLVDDLAVAEARIAKGLPGHASPVVGIVAPRGILIPAAVANGVWLELHAAQ